MNIAHVFVKDHIKFELIRTVRTVVRIIMFDSIVNVINIIQANFLEEPLSLIMGKLCHK